VRFMRFQIFLVRPPLFNEDVHGRTRFLESLLSFLKRRCNRLQPPWDFSALILDLCDPKIQFL